MTSHWNDVVTDITDTLTQNESSLSDFVPSAIPVFTWGSVNSDAFVITLKLLIVKLFIGEIKYHLEILARNLY